MPAGSCHPIFAGRVDIRIRDLRTWSALAMLTGECCNIAAIGAMQLESDGEYAGGSVDTRDARLIGASLRNGLNALLAAWPPLFLGMVCGAIALASYFALPTTVPAALFGFGGVAFAADARARQADFRRARARIRSAARRSEGVLARELTQLYQQHKRSWCQRTSLIWAAASAVGPAGSRFVRRGFRKHGYQWWHITPDGTFSRHCPFLKLSFWWALFGLPDERRRA
jgi:hypothetical protein